MFDLDGETCGEKCWTAIQEDCSCSCGGANHGLLAREGEITADKIPQRYSKIFGVLYELKAVGYYRQLEPERKKVNETCGWWQIRGTKQNPYHVSWDSAKPREHPPAILKYATPSQLNSWFELKAFQSDQRLIRTVSLLWVLADMYPDNYCEDECSRCFNHRVEHKYGGLKVDKKSTADEEFDNFYDEEEEM
jgi:hypothetical protein